MRRIARMLVPFMTAVGVGSIAIGQAPQPRRQAPAPAAAPARGPANAKIPTAAEIAAQKKEMDQLLVLWERQSTKLTSLVASFKRVDRSEAWGELIEYEGNAYLQNPSLACLHFKKNTQPAPAPGQKPAPPTFVEHERIVCTGKDVLQYDYATKEIFRFPLNKEERKKALEEGPLPFLFNMKADEARLRYSMSIYSQNTEAYVLTVRPLLNEDKEVFSTAFLQLNKKTFLPDRLMLVATNGKDTQDYIFNKVSPNQPIDPKFFTAIVAIKGWKLIDNPAPRGPVGQRPAMAPR